MSKTNDVMQAALERENQRAIERYDRERGVAPTYYATDSTGCDTEADEAATGKGGPCGHHYSWGQRCQQPPDAEVHKWGLAQYGHSTPDGMPRHPWASLYPPPAPASDPVERETVEEQRIRDFFDKYHESEPEREWKVGDYALLRNFTPPLVARLTYKPDSSGMWHADAGFGGMGAVIIAHESNMERVPDDCSTCGGAGFLNDASRCPDCGMKEHNSRMAEGAKYLGVDDEGRAYYESPAPETPKPEEGEWEIGDWMIDDLHPGCYAAMQARDGSKWCNRCESAVVFLSGRWSSPAPSETPSPEVGIGEMLQMLIGRGDFGELETSLRLLPDKSYQSEWSMAFYFGEDDYSLFCGSTWREVVSKAYRHFYAAAKEQSK
jgi:hypothetical protein